MNMSGKTLPRPVRDRDPSIGTVHGDDRTHRAPLRPCPRVRHRCTGHRGSGRDGMARAARRRGARSVPLRCDRRWSFEPDLPRRRRRRRTVRAPTSTARAPPCQRARHGTRVPHHRRAAEQRRAGGASTGLLRRPRGQRRAVLRDGLRRRARHARPRGGRGRARPRRRADRASRSIVETMAAIHAVDLEAVGLADLGKHEGYIARQLKRWYGQWNAQKTRELAAVDTVHDALLQRIPEQGPATIVHGDYRLDNCMVGDDGTVIAVLDWEICTLGDPMADLGLLQVYWTGPDDDASAWIGSSTTATGFWNRAQLATRYAEVSGRDISQLPFYVSFAYWKLACILEGVYARYLGGALGRARCGRARAVQAAGRRRGGEGVGRPRGTRMTRTRACLSLAPGAAAARVASARRDADGMDRRQRRRRRGDGGDRCCREHHVAGHLRRRSVHRLPGPAPHDGAARRREHTARVARHRAEGRPRRRRPRPAAAHRSRTRCSVATVLGSRRRPGHRARGEHGVGAGRLPLRLAPHPALAVVVQLAVGRARRLGAVLEELGRRAGRYGCRARARTGRRGVRRWGCGHRYRTTWAR